MAGAKNTRGLTSLPPLFWITCLHHQCLQLGPYFRHWSLIGTFWGKSENLVPKWSLFYQFGLYSLKIGETHVTKRENGFTLSPWKDFEPRVPLIPSSYLVSTDSSPVGKIITFFLEKKPVPPLSKSPFMFRKKSLYF